jgi:ribosomal protein S18 acetylase RimI-like enzyme
MYTVQRVTPEQLAAGLEPFVALLRDSVEGGASVGFLPPVPDEEAVAYWTGVRAALAAGHRVLLAARDHETLLGAVQLDLATMPNARHRAEVMKLMVHRQARRRGIGRALMLALEDVARAEGRRLVVLDTRVGDAAQQLYVSLGYTAAGVIPRYAMSAAGTLEATVYMYKELG